MRPITTTSRAMRLGLWSIVVLSACALVSIAWRRHIGESTGPVTHLLIALCGACGILAYAPLLTGMEAVQREGFHAFARDLCLAVKAAGHRGATEMELRRTAKIARDAVMRDANERQKAEFRIQRGELA